MRATTTELMKHLHSISTRGFSCRIFTILCTAALLLAAASSLTSCKSKAKQDPNKSYEELQADAITSIKASNAITVKFIQEEGTPQITVVSKKAYTDQLDVHMEGSVLVATYKANAQIAESGVEVIVHAPAINEIETDMAAIVNLGDKLELTGDLRIKCNRAGSVKGKKVACNNLIIETDRAAVVQLGNLEANDITAKAVRASTIVLDGKAISYNFQQAADNQIIHDKLSTKNGDIKIIPDPVDPADVPKATAPKGTAPKTTAPKDTTKSAAAKP